MSDKTKKKKGFTLVELLAVIVILGIVITIISISVAKTMKKAKNKAFITSYEVILDSVLKSINSKNLNLSDDSDVICFNTEECSKIYYVSKDNYLMAVVKNGDDSYTVAVTGKGDFENVSFDSTIRDEKMICSSNYCVSNIVNGEIKRPNDPEHVYAIKYHYYNNEITKDGGIKDNLVTSINTAFKTVAEEFIKIAIEEKTTEENITKENVTKYITIEDISKVFDDPNILGKVSDSLYTNINKYNDELEKNLGTNKMKVDIEELNEKYCVFKIIVTDSSLGYKNYYSFNDKGMKNICMPKDNNDNDERLYYIAINYVGEVIDSSFLAEEGYCNLPG